MSGRHPKDWNGLDNAAKIFPATSNKEDGKVFRFSCELEEPVCCTDLQEALDQTMEFFPFYRSVLKKGLFWYYLKTSDLRPLVSEEDAPPCAPIYDTDRNCLLFSVTYYHRRINLEIYHALSDGTGALHFLRTLVACYLTIHHPELFPDGTPVIDYDATNSQKAEDSFKKYYKPGSKRYESKEKVYRLHGDKLPEGRIRVIEGRMSVSRILELSRSYHVSMTTFLSGILLQAISHNMSLSDKKKLVVLMVPVNLRNFFHSVSARNFFCTIDVPYQFGQGKDDLKAILQEVDRVFQDELTQEKLSERMNGFAALEHNLFIRLAPLFFKNPVMRYYNFQSDRRETSSISNLGRVVMPECYRPLIRGFDVFTSTKKLQVCICSYEDVLSICSTSAFLSTDIEKDFFRLLTGMGVEVEITANRIDEEGRGQI